MHSAWVHAIPPVSHHIPPGVKAVRLETWQTYAIKAMFWTIGAFGEMLSMPKVVFTTQATLDEDSGGCYVYNHPGDATPMDEIEHSVVLMLEN
jgi:hypothetical protein